MKAPPVLIQLTFLETTVASVRSDELTDPIAIGREAACAWRAPAGDRTMGAQAAVLQLKGGEPFLKAGEGAAFRVNGLEARDRILRAGDRVAIGDCEIKVASIGMRHLFVPWHRLEEIGGARKGGFVDLKGETFSVGSAADANLRLRDDTVSHRHATLTLKGDECWVHDETSRNGTRVNGQRLGGKERLLRDGDILSFGPFDYRFLDRAVRHVRTNSAKGILAVLATLGIAAGAWYAFYRRTPDVTAYLLAAADFAAEERFGEAEQMFREAKKARGFDGAAATWRGRRERLAVWRATHDAWNDFKETLQAERFNAACTQIGLLSLDRRTSWDWNDRTLESRLAEAREAAELTQLAYDLWCARNESELSDAFLESLAARRTRFGIDRVGYAEDGRPWMKTLKTCLVTRAKLFDENETRFALLTNELSRLATGSLNPVKVTNDVARAFRESSGHVRLFAHQLWTPILKLEADYGKILADARALAALDAGAYRGCPVATTPDDCAVSDYLGESQRWCVRERRKLDLASLELRAMRDRLRKFGADGTDTPPSLCALEDTNRVEKAFRCELLKASRPPNPNREQPVDDEYDRLFGYEFLYAYMVEGYYAFPNDVDMTKIVTQAFDPEIRKLWFLGEEIDRDLKILRGAEFSDLRTGALADFESRLAAWRARILSVARRFDAIADDPRTKDERRGVLARGASIYLLPMAQVEKHDWDDFRRRAAWYQQNVLTRVDDLNPAQPEKSRAAVDWIVEHALPGGPVIRKVWSYRR